MEIQKEKAFQLGKTYSENDYDPQDADDEIKALVLEAIPNGVSPEVFEDIQREIIMAFDEGYFSRIYQ